MNRNKTEDIPVFENGVLIQVLHSTTEYIVKYKNIILDQGMAQSSENFKNVLNHYDVLTVREILKLYNNKLNQIKMSLKSDIKLLRKEKIVLEDRFSLYDKIEQKYEELKAISSPDEINDDNN